MDPRKFGPQQRSANLSDLMIAKGRASMGESVNFCPFGCENEQLDDNGYCRHLVGFTCPGDDSHYQPMVKVGGRRTVEGPDMPVHKKDKLVRATVCSRVYREDVPEEAEQVA